MAPTRISGLHSRKRRHDAALGRNLDSGYGNVRMIRRTDLTDMEIEQLTKCPPQLVDVLCDHILESHPDWVKCVKDGETIGIAGSQEEADKMVASHGLKVELSALNPAQKMAYVEHQIFRAQRGEIDMIECPYCGIGCALGVASLCCKLMGDAVTAVLFKMETTAQLQMAAQIAENVDRQAEGSVLVH